jgi:hypothetical protein
MHGLSSRILAKQAQGPKLNPSIEKIKNKERERERQKKSNHKVSVQKGPISRR